MFMERHRDKGFTILELLIVVAIIGVLAAMALPRFQDATNNARCSVERGNIRQIDTQIELYQITVGRFPDYPNMQRLLESTTYFPGGRPTDPFLNVDSLGTYTQDVSGSPPRNRVLTFPHLNVSGGHALIACP